MSKKLLAVFFALLLAMAFAACGDDDEKKPVEPPELLDGADVTKPAIAFSVDTSVICVMTLVVVG